MSSFQGSGGSTQPATTYKQRSDDYSSTTSALDQWLQWCDDNNVMAPALILNQWVRGNAPHKDYKNKSLGAMLKDDCIHVKDWTTGENFTFFDSRPATPSQRKQQRIEIDKSRRLADELRIKKQAEAANEAAKLWHEAIHAPVAGYFESKSLYSSHGAKWHQRLGCWLVLMTDVCGAVYTVQKIYNNGNKRFYKGGRITGGMALIGSLVTAKRVLVCEGFATGCTLHEHAGHTVACAFNAGNLISVCKAIRDAYPSVEIIVFGDDDRFNDVNTGRLKANEAAEAVNGKVAFPSFHPQCKSCTDANDAVNCQLCGGEL